MPIQRTYQQSDIEKRLKLLTRQLYGKSSENLRITQSTRESDNPVRGDLAYLKHDLIKIVILSSLATLALFLLYFSQLPSKIKLF